MAPPASASSRRRRRCAAPDQTRRRRAAALLLADVADAAPARAIAALRAGEARRAARARRGAAAVDGGLAAVAVPVRAGRRLARVLVGGRRGDDRADTARAAQVHVTGLSRPAARAVSGQVAAVDVQLAAVRHPVAAGPGL